MRSLPRPRQHLSSVGWTLYAREPQPQPQQQQQHQRNSSSNSNNISATAAATATTSAQQQQQQQQQHQRNSSSNSNIISSNNISGPCIRARSDTSGEAILRGQWDNDAATPATATSQISTERQCTE
eukprot:1187572-Prorocentrum_minimum.AAC.4